jgi:hypothetical protein
MAIAQVYRAVQVGVESTAGTGVAANKKLDSFDLTITGQGESQIYSPVGNKRNTVVIPPGKRWTQASLEGVPTYTQMGYLLAALLKAPTITTPAGATNTRKWLFNLSASGQDDPKTLTIEQGNSTRAQKFTYGHLNEFGLEFSKSEVGMSGTIMGRALQDSVAITGSPTAIALQPIAPQEIDVYFADTQAGLDGATKLAGDYSVSFKISNRFSQLFALDSAQTSFGTIVELKPEVELSLVLDADDAGYAPLAKLTAGGKQFIRVKATGPQTEVGQTYLFNLDFCGAVMSYPGTGEQDGAVTVEWTFKAIEDATWGKDFEIYLHNLLTSL